jgi:hypothetical protein
MDTDFGALPPLLAALSLLIRVSTSGALEIDQENTTQLKGHKDMVLIDAEVHVEALNSTFAGFIAHCSGDGVRIQSRVANAGFGFRRRHGAHLGPRQQVPAFACPLLLLEPRF